MSKFQSIVESELRSIEGGAVGSDDIRIGAAFVSFMAIVVNVVGTGTLKGLDPEITKKIHTPK